MSNFLFNKQQEQTFTQRALCIFIGFFMTFAQMTDFKRYKNKKQLKKSFIKFELKTAQKIPSNLKNLNLYIHLSNISYKLTSEIGSTFPIESKHNRKYSNFKNLEQAPT